MNFWKKKNGLLNNLCYIMISTTVKEMANHKYDYKWIAMRLEFLIENSMVYIDRPSLKIKYCDEEYLISMTEEANEVLETFTVYYIKTHIQRFSYLPKDFPKFSDYAKQTISDLVSQKLKLIEDECISHFKIAYEKDMPS